MSKAPIPITIDPWRSAEQGLGYEGSVQLSKLTGLVDYLSDQDGGVDVSLTFGVDEERIRFLKGSAQVTVQMTCQRCLEPVAVPLSAELVLGMVHSDEAAKNLPKRYDPLVVTDNELDVNQAIEEELILTLPLIPVHQDCDVKTEFVDPDDDQSESDKDNPFSILAQLKGKKH